MYCIRCGYNNSNWNATGPQTWGAILSNGWVKIIEIPYDGFNDSDNLFMTVTCSEIDDRHTWENIGSVIGLCPWCLIPPRV